MNLTRHQLAEVVNRHVTGYWRCAGAYDLADIILAADREAHRERFEERPVADAGAAPQE